MLYLPWIAQADEVEDEAESMLFSRQLARIEWKMSNMVSFSSLLFLLLKRSRNVPVSMGTY